MANEWNDLRTPKDWHEPMFVTEPEEDKIPLWASILAACGAWAVAKHPRLYN